MKGLILSTIMSTLLSHGVHTTHPAKPVAVPLPEKCPSVAVIASQGLDHVSPFLLGGLTSWMGVKETARYDTNDNWTFLGIQVDGDKDGKVAIQQISSQLAALKINGNPQIDEENQVAFCVYYAPEEQASGLVAIAYTPASYS